MKNSKVSIDVAVQDFERWLSLKNVKPRKREDNKAFEENIVDCIVDGQLTIDEKCIIKFTLPEAVKNTEGEETLKDLTFVPRIKVQELNAKLKGVKPDDADGRIVAHIAAITGLNSGMIKQLYTEDYSICQAIVMYFL